MNLLAKLIIGGGLAIAPATAQAFSAFDSFNLTGGNNPFTYGTFDTVSGMFNAYTNTTACGAIANTTCKVTAAGGVPGAFKTTGGAFPADGPSGTVNVPANALIFHPGSGTDEAAVLYTASTAGTYGFSFSFAQSDTNPNSVTVSSLLNGTRAQLGTLTTATPTFSVSNFTVVLGAGDTFGLSVGNNGSYFNDSTAVNFGSSAAVPEASTWAMMIIGFGAVGGTMRRRQRTLAAA